MFFIVVNSSELYPGFFLYKLWNLAIVDYLV